MADKVHIWNQSDIERRLKSAVSQITPDVRGRLDLSLPQEKIPEKLRKTGGIRKYFSQTGGRLKGLAAAACLCLILGSGYYWEFRQVVTVVSLDVNPSLEFYLNRRDTVIKTVAKNDDGEAVASKADVTGRKLSEAVDQVVAAMAEEGYLKQEENEKSAVLVTVSSRQNEQKTEKLTRDVTAGLEYSLAANEVPAVVYGQPEADDSARQEIRQIADEYQISQGKAAFIQSLAAENEELQEEEVSQLAQMNMSEISNQIEENSYRLGSQVQVVSVTEETITKVRVIRSASSSGGEMRSAGRTAPESLAETEPAPIKEKEPAAVFEPPLENKDFPAKNDQEPELEMSTEGKESELGEENPEPSGQPGESEAKEQTVFAKGSAESIESALGEDLGANIQSEESSFSQIKTEENEGAETEEPSEECIKEFCGTEGSAESAETESGEAEESLTEDSGTGAEAEAESKENSETEEAADGEPAETTDTEEETEEESAECIETEEESAESTEAEEETAEESKESIEAEEETAEESAESTEAEEETEEESAESAEAEEETEEESAESAETEEETAEESAESAEPEEGSEADAEDSEDSDESGETTEAIRKSKLPFKEQYGPGMEEAIWEREWFDEEDQAGQWLYGPGVSISGDPLQADTIYNSAHIHLRLNSKRQWVGSISEKMRSRWYFQLTRALQMEEDGGQE